MPKPSPHKGKARLNRKITDSSPCFAGQSLNDVDDAYMGKAVPLALVDALQKLLMAERAGVRVATESLHTPLPESGRLLMEQVRSGEAQSCKLLREVLMNIGVTPTVKVGDFYEKAMAIDNIHARVQLIDRGRDWVFNHIQQLLVDCHDAQITTALTRVLELHQHPVKFNDDKP